MKKILFLFVTLLFSASCDSFLDIEPVGQVIPNSEEEFRAFITSAYAITSPQKVLTSYRTDELALEYNATGIDQYKDVFIWNDLNTSPLTQAFPYGSFYNIIFYTNYIINSKEDIIGEQTAIDQLVGEAYALRAMQYFELVNLYAKTYNPTTAKTDAGVPITTFYDTDQEYPKQSVEEVYTLILNDLDQAENLINVEKQALGYNYRFSTVAIKAFKARVYLYQKEWQKAINSANEALAINSALQNLNEDNEKMPSEYDSVESILALEIVASFDLVKNASISTDLIAAYHPTEDLRLNLYFNKNANGKMESNKSAETKFKVSYRTSELYLIQAEALAELQKPDLARNSLFELAVNRYTEKGFEDYKLKVNSLDSSDLLKEILEERRRELAIEGHRWNDLRRTDQPEISKLFDGVRYTLKKADERYVIPFPRDAKINNPLL